MPWYFPRFHKPPGPSEGSLSDNYPASGKAAVCPLDRSAVGASWVRYAGFAPASRSFNCIVQMPVSGSSVVRVSVLSERLGLGLSGASDLGRRDVESGRTHACSDIDPVGAIPSPVDNRALFLSPIPIRPRLDHCPVALRPILGYQWGRSLTLPLMKRTRRWATAFVSKRLNQKLASCCFASTPAPTSRITSTLKRPGFSGGSFI